MRLWFTVCILLAVAVIGGGSIWWMFLASYGERQWQANQQRLQEQGYTLEYGRLERGGFPLAVEWIVHDVTLSHPGEAEGQRSFSGQADRVRFVSALWSPQEVAFQVEGQHRWQVDTGGGPGIVDIAVDSASGTIGPRPETDGWRVETRLGGITARPRGEAAGDLTVRTATVVAETPLGMDALRIDARLEQIGLPQDFGLGREAALLQLSGSIRPLPADYSRDALSSWQAAEGQMTISDAQVRLGPLRGGADGELGLDRDLRPRGEMAVRVQEPTELLALAQKRGWIDQERMPLYAMATSMFTRNNTDGEKEAAVKVGFRDGGVWLGPVRLADLPPVVGE